MANAPLPSSTYDGQASPQGGAQDFYNKPPGSDVVYHPPSQANLAPDQQQQQQYGGYAQPPPPPPVGNVAEVPAVNPVGTGNNRAELA